MKNKTHKFLHIIFNTCYLIKKYFYCCTAFFRGPMNIDVELASICNFRCLKCPTYEGTRSRGFMNDKVFDKILTDIKSTNWKVSLVLTGSGEVILHPNIVQFIENAKKVSQIKKIQIGTNAFALNCNLSRSLIKAGVTNFKISLDTDNREEFASINRVDGLDQVEKNIIELCEIIKEQKASTKVELKITCYRNQPEKLTRLLNKWRNIVHVIRATNLHNWGGLRGLKKDYRKTPCRILFNMMQIRWDGSLTLCCCDVMSPTYNFGNVTTQNLKAYWYYNKELKNAKRSHLRINFDKLALCQTCTLDDPSYQNLFLGTAKSEVAGV